MDNKYGCLPKHFLTIVRKSPETYSNLKKSQKRKKIYIGLNGIWAEEHTQKKPFMILFDYAVCN